MILDSLLLRQRLVFSLVALLVVVGLLSWAGMPRQEDPSFVERFATVIVPLPGADAERVERLVVRPIEDELADVEALRQVEVTARANVAVFQLRLRDRVYATTEAWDTVREALDRAAPELPSEAGAIELDTDVGDPHAVVVLVTGSNDPLALRDAGHQVEDRLLQVEGVSRVVWLADPGARIAVRLDPATGRRMGLDARGLAAQLGGRNVTLPAGTLRAGGRALVLRPESELADLDELRQTPIMLPDGSAVPLAELAQVTLEPQTPARVSMRHDGQPAVGLSVVPTRPQDLVAFGEHVEQAIGLAQGDIAPLQLEVFSFQPELVRHRLAQLSTSLMLGVCIIGAVLIGTMGVRLGAVVASVVPLVTLSTVGLYAIGGGVLHQISIAALVLALGLLVDNAIVMAEAVQQHLDRGHSPLDAARAAIRDLALPLGAATGTTLAAFTPMLLSAGATADFTRSIPVVLMIALALSYVFALAVTPALAARWLKADLRPRRTVRLRRVADWLGTVPVRAPKRTLGVVALAVGCTGVLATWVPQEFFPMSDRSQLVVTLALPEGSHLSATETVATDLAEQIRDLPEVATSTAFIGRGPPRFYYNLNNVPEAPHSATLVATVHDRSTLDATLDAVRVLAREHPQATVVAKRLQQGPPVGAPVEVRISGSALDDLNTTAASVIRVLRAQPGVRDVRSNVGVGVPSVRWDLDDAVAARAGVGRGDVALALLGRTRGLDAGVWRGSWDPVSVQVVGPGGEDTSLAALATTDIAPPGQPSLPLAQLGATEVRWTPAAIHHRDRQRTVRVSAELDPGTTFGAVVRNAKPELATLTLPAGTTVTWGGEAEGSAEANQALLGTLPIGLGLLLVFLLLEFNSFRRVGIVLLTVPLAATGVVPGLALAGQPFGFMSMLGVTSLVGIVVNNAIVLLEVVEQQRGSGASVEEALHHAVRVRLRPILLTTATTVSGLLPLALSSSSLWPPLAWAMISGLVASTGLTLVAVPALYTLMFDRPRPHLRALWPLLGLGLTAQAGAGAMTLDDVTRLAGEQSPAVTAADQASRAAAADTATAWRTAIGPTVGVEVEGTWRNHEVAVVTPFGPIRQQPDQQLLAGAEARVPMFAPAGWIGAAAADRAAQAQRMDATWVRRQTRARAVDAFLEVVAIEGRLEALAQSIEALATVAERARSTTDAGLTLPADALRAEVALADARYQATALGLQRDIAARQLGLVLGMDEPVEPVYTYSSVDPLDELDLEDQIALARDDRPDLLALDARAASLRSQRAAVWASALPTLEGVGAYRWTDNDALVESGWWEVGARLRWTPIAGGTRPAQTRAISHRAAAVRTQRDALSRSVGVEVRAAAAAIESARLEVSVRTAAVQQAREALDIVAGRYDQGLASLSDVLQVEAELRAQHTRQLLSQIEVSRARSRLTLATGRGG